MSERAPVPRRRQRLGRLADAARWALIVGGCVVIGQALAGAHRDETPAPRALPAGSSVQALDGSALALGQPGERVVVLNFWATWCPACRAELPELAQFASEEQARCVTVVGVSEEARPTLAAFVARRPLSYPVAHDSAGLADALGVTVLPTTFILDLQGRVVQRIEGGTSAARLREVIAPWRRASPRC